MTDFSCFAAKPEFAIRVVFPEEKEHAYRNRFERDRDRILYSKGFRRLSGKTQIFITGYDDHARNRLTHTLEVVQLSKTISKQIGLNVELTEAIAYAHDIGHTPFGHAGESILNSILNGCIIIKDFNKGMDDEQKGIKHNWQGVRRLIDLETYSNKYYGLNLTDHTLWGILHHTNLEWKQCGKIIEENGRRNCGLLHEMKVCLNDRLKLDFYNRYAGLIGNSAFTIEAQVVSWADEISQRHHDLEDGLNSKIINEKECIDKIIRYFAKFFSVEELQEIAILQNEYKEWRNTENYAIHKMSTLIINTLVNKLIQNTKNNLKSLKTKYKINSQNDFYSKKDEIINCENNWGSIVSYDAEFGSCHDTLKNYLKRRILNSFKTQSMDGKATHIIIKLFKAYVTNPQQLPDRTIRTLFSNYYRNKNQIKKVKTVWSKHGIGYWRDKLEKMHYTDDTSEYKAAVLRTICDFVSSMTDSFATKQYKLLYNVTE